MFDALTNLGGPSIIPSDDATEKPLVGNRKESHIICKRKKGPINGFYLKGMVGS